MITSAKNYTKKQTNKKMDRETPRTNGKRKAMQTKSHTEAYHLIPIRWAKKKPQKTDIPNFA